MHEDALGPDVTVQVADFIMQSIECSHYALQVGLELTWLEEGDIFKLQELAGITLVEIRRD